MASPNKLKNLSACKPDSVSCFHTEVKSIKTSWLSFIWSRYCYRDLAAYPSASDEPPSNADIRGITAHKVYPINASLQKSVSSYLTFSPLLLSCHVRFCQAELVEALSNHVKRGVVIFCGTFSSRFNREPRCYRGVLLFAVRTFLPPINRGTITRLIEGKGSFFIFWQALSLSNCYYPITTLGYFLVILFIILLDL